MKMAGSARKTTEGVWQINLCRDWKSDWAWSSLAPGGYEKSGLRFVFTKEPGPVVQYTQDGDPTFPPSRGRLAIRNPSAQPLALKASLTLTRNKMPSPRSWGDVDHSGRRRNGAGLCHPRERLHHGV